METLLVPHEFKLSLLENAMDFILKGIDELFDDTYALRPDDIHAMDIASRNYKYGILDLFSGFLLLLKECLARHHPDLIYAGKLTDVKQRRPNGAVRNTVSLDEALERLEFGPRVTFTEDEVKLIQKMRRCRNEFEHYEVQANKYELWHVLSAFLILIDRFLINVLQVTIESYDHDSTDPGFAVGSATELHHKIALIDSVWARRVTQLENDWKADAAVRLARFEENTEEILAELVFENHRNKGAFQQFDMCPECDRETLIVMGEYSGICSNEDCGKVHPLTSCARCGEITVGFNWEWLLCDNCVQLLASDMT